MCLVPKAGDREEGQARRQSTKLGVRLVYKAGGKTGELELEVGKESEDLLSISLVSMASKRVSRKRLAQMLTEGWGKKERLIFWLLWPASHQALKIQMTSYLSLLI